MQCILRRSWTSLLAKVFRLLSDNIDTCRRYRVPIAYCNIVAVHWPSNWLLFESNFVRHRPWWRFCLSHWPRGIHSDSSWPQVKIVVTWAILFKRSRRRWISFNSSAVNALLMDKLDWNERERFSRSDVMVETGLPDSAVAMIPMMHRVSRCSTLDWWTRIAAAMTIDSPLISTRYWTFSRRSVESMPWLWWQSNYSLHRHRVMF